MENIDLYLKRLGDDFPFFLHELWPYAVGKRPARIQLDMAQWIQEAPARSVILGFRGLSKTWICLAYCAWNLFRDKDHRIMISSASSGLGRRNLRLIRKWVGRVPFLSHLTPRRAMTHRATGGKAKAFDLDHSDHFEVAGCSDSNNPSVFTVGISGTLPGFRAHLVLGDDIETRENSLTPETRYALRERVQEFESILFPDVDDSRIMFIGTPHHRHDSLYWKLSEAGYTIRSFPVVYPNRDELARMPYVAPGVRVKVEMDEGVIGQPLWPERFNKAWAMRKRAAVLPYYWELQWMLMKPAAEDTANQIRIRMEDFIVMPVDMNRAPATVVWGKMAGHGHSPTILDMHCNGLDNDAFYGPVFIDPRYEEYHRRVMYVDPSGGGADETAWAVAFGLYGNIFVKEAGAYKGGHHDENLCRIAESAKRNRVHEIVIENNYAGDTFIQLVKAKTDALLVKPGVDPNLPKGWGCLVLPKRNNKKKTQRILHTIAQLSHQHRIIIDPSVAANDTLVFQLTRMEDEDSLSRSHSREDFLVNDDRADALAGVCELFGDNLDLSNDSVRKINKSRLEKEVLDDLKYYGIHKPAGKYCY